MTIVLQNFTSNLKGYILNYLRWEYGDEGGYFKLSRVHLERVPDVPSLHPAVVLQTFKGTS